MTEKAPAKRRGFDLHPSNPFLPSTDVKTKTRRVTNRRGDMMLVSNEGEIVSNVAGFWEAEEVDSTKFLKLFVNGVKALAELSNAGTKVFELLYLEMQANVGRDVVFLSFSRVDQSVTPMSDSTYTRGMRELIDKKFLAASPSQGLFWVNPDFLWNGDRLAFVKEYRRAGGGKKAIPKDTATGDLFDGEVGHK